MESKNYMFGKTSSSSLNLDKLIYEDPRFVVSITNIEKKIENGLHYLDPLSRRERFFNKIMNEIQSAVERGYMATSDERRKFNVERATLDWKYLKYDYKEKLGADIEDVAIFLNALNIDDGEKYRLLCKLLSPLAGDPEIMGCSY